MELSLTAQAIIEAYERGYWISENGIVTSHRGHIMSEHRDKNGYKKFAYRFLNGKKINIQSHRFQGYFKYGDMIFISDIVNHIDGNVENNHINNIQLATNKGKVRRKNI